MCACPGLCGETENSTWTENHITRKEKRGGFEPGAVCGEALAEREACTPHDVAGEVGGPVPQHL